MVSFVCRQDRVTNLKPLDKSTKQISRYSGWMPCFIASLGSLREPWARSCAHFPETLEKRWNYRRPMRLASPPHHVEKVQIVLAGLHLVEDELHRLDLVHRIEQLSQDPGLLQDLGLEQQLFT